MAESLLKITLHVSSGRGLTTIELDTQLVHRLHQARQSRLRRDTGTREPPLPGGTHGPELALRRNCHGKKARLVPQGSESCPQCDSRTRGPQEAREVPQKNADDRQRVYVPRSPTLATLQERLPRRWLISNHPGQVHNERGTASSCGNQ